MAVAAGSWRGVGKSRVVVSGRLGFVLVRRAAELLTTPLYFEFFLFLRAGTDKD